MKTFVSGCSGLGSIFQIFPLTVNQRPETVTLLPLGLVYLFLCFLFKSFHSPFTSTILRLSTFEAKKLMSLENFSFVFTYNLLLWRSIVTCNRCNIVSPHKCLTYTDQTFCAMSFNRKLIKFFWGNISKLRGRVCFIFAWTSRGF